MYNKKFSNFLKFTFIEFRRVFIELKAYEMAFTALKLTLEHDHPGFSELAAGGLDAARISPALHDWMREQFDAPMEKLLRRVSEAQTEEETEKALLEIPMSKLVH